MRRLFIPLVFLVVWTFNLGGLAAAQRIDPATKIPFFSQMTQKAKEQGHIRVIVQMQVADIEFLNTASAQFKTGRGDAATIVRAVSADGLLAARIASTADDLFNRTGSQGIEVRHRYSAFPLLALDVSSEMLSILAQDPQVLQITEDHLARPFLDNTVDIVGATGSWDSGYTGTGWYVAILDTGIRSSHDFFNGKSIVEACFAAGSDPPGEGHCPNNDTSMTGAGSAAHHPSSYYGWDHGTHVAGIAAGNDDPNLNGVAKDAGIIAVQVFSRFDDPDACGADNPCVLSYNSDIIAGLEYIYSLRATYNIAAVNLSLGGEYYTAPCDTTFGAFKTPIDQLRNAGIATVVASGNDGHCDGIAAPACISSAVVVGATSNADVMASFSNYHGDLVDLFAPGIGIRSSVGDTDSSYASWSGTSMATPHVTGAFAILRQFNNTAPVTELLTALMDSGETADDSTECGDSGTLPVARLHIEIIPIAPDELVATAVDSNAITLSWNDNATSESGFKIDRKTGVGGIYSEIGDEGANTVTYNDTSSLSEGTAYYYRIRAYNDEGNSPYSADANTSTLLIGPTAFVAATISDTQINLTWTDNSSAESGFEIDRRTSSGSFAQIATLGANAINFSDTGLSAGTTYYYRLRSTNGTVASLYAQANANTTGGGGGGSSGGCFLSAILH